MPPPLPMGLATTLRTIRHLTPRQAVGQVWVRATGPALHPRAAQAAGLHGVALDRPLPLPVGEGWRLPTGAIELLGQPPHDPLRQGWDAHDRDRLWRYTLHYHGVLGGAGEPMERDRAAMLHWIADHPRGVGWEPYPTSMRLLRWLPWLTRHALDPSDRATLLGSIAAQAEHLERHIEHHIDGNHVWTNLAALALVGLVTDGPRAAQLRARHLPAFAATVARQCGPDGVHAERTPTYHCLLAQQLGQVVAAADASVTREAAEQREPLAQALAAMVDATAAFTHPDGDVALWGDSQRAHPAGPLALPHAPRAGAAALTRGPADAPHAGFVRRQFGPWTLLWNAGGVGMPQQVGHIHADALSLELSLGRERVVVDAGTGTYEPGEARSYARSTVAHSTLTLGPDHRDQHELWASHRIGARARARLLEHGLRRVVGEVRGAGWPATHRREIWGDERRVRIHDAVQTPGLLGARAPAAVTRLHLPAALELTREGPTIVARTPAGSQFRVIPSAGVQLRIEPAPGWTAIGRPAPRQCLVGALDGAHAHLDLVAERLRGAPLPPTREP